MTLVSEHIESDTRERILVVAERLFRQIGYQKTTVADAAKESPLPRSGAAAGPSRVPPHAGCLYFS
jgi:AcrR family transcriptional regulator